jgi:acyl carrier protein
MLARLGEIAAARGLPEVRLPYRRTAKNKPALQFVESLARAPELSDSGALYVISSADAAAVHYRPDNPPGEPDSGDDRAEKDAGTAERSVDYARIAAEWNSAPAILEAVRAAGRVDAVRTTPYEAPRTPLEKRLAALWSEMLNVPSVGVNDNFFDLGGHSLLAVQLLSRVREELQADLSLDVVFSGVFSVAELAKAIELHEIERAGGEEYEALLAEIEGLTDEEVRALLEKEGGDERDTA